MTSIKDYKKSHKTTVKIEQEESPATNQINISLNKSRILAFIVLLFALAVVLTPIWGVALFQNFNLLLSWEFLVAGVILVGIWVYIFYLTKRLNQKTPGLVINNEGYTNYLYKQPKLITWQELSQGELSYDRHHFLTLCIKGVTQIIDAHIHFTILKITPKKLMRILEEKRSEYLRTVILRLESERSSS